MPRWCCGPGVGKLGGSLLGFAEVVYDRLRGDSHLQELSVTTHAGLAARKSGAIVGDLRELRFYSFTWERGLAVEV